MARKLTIVLLVALLHVAPASAEDLQRSVPAEPGGSLTVDLDSGSVEVIGHPEHEVRVDARAAGLGSGRADFDLSSDGSEVRLTGNFGGFLSGLIGAGSVRVRVRVPTEFSVDVRTKGGSVEVEDLEGDVSARTNGGSISVDSIRGGADLRTSGGSVDATNVSDDLRARTSGGPIRAADVGGDVDAETSGGPIRAYDVAGGVSARTSGGSISVRFAAEPEGDIETSGGGIEVELPSRFGADLDARTSGGRIELERGVTVRGSIDRDRVVGELNGGGSELRVRTSGGNIRVRVR
jgi:hypothetical protein